MKLYLLQQIFTFGDKFVVYDEKESERYYVEGELFSFGKKLHVYNTYDEEVALIHQHPFSFPPTFTVKKGERELATIVKEFTLFHQAYTVEGPDWQVDGNFFDHEYTISKGDQVIATVSKEWFTFGDSYEIDVKNDHDEVVALCTALVIDVILED